MNSSTGPTSNPSTITALITPFKHLQLDVEGLCANINFQIAQGIDGLLLLGTTGEACTLTPAEQTEVIKIGVAEAGGRVPVWVGTGSYSTEQTIEKTAHAQRLGADAALVVTPYYNKPTQEGIFRHFEAITAAVDLPLVVYNIPGRCGTNIEVATLLRMARLPHIMGIKESSGNISHTSEIVAALSKTHPEFKVYCGDDALTLPMIALGASGVISVLSNIVPEEIISLVKAALKSDFSLAKEIHYRLYPLFKAAFLETNPIPIKTAMDFLGLPAGGCRLPLYHMHPANVTLLKEALETLQLIEI